MDPWETGSYDLALEEAGIADFNIVPYTSGAGPPCACFLTFLTPCGFTSELVLFLAFFVRLFF
jgi:Pyruvoyl-dependent arginine decarboxylase (PvlArgDC)